MTDDWERVLFCPPAWPYKDGDPEAPAAHPTIKQYGYDIRQLDRLPIQDGYDEAEFERPTVSEEEARTYYMQFQVFRDIMLDKEWSKRQKKIQDRQHRRRSSITSMHRRRSSTASRTAVSASKSKKKDKALAGVSPGATFAILRMPLLGLIWGAILLELLAYIVVRQIVRAYERLYIWQGRRGQLYQKMRRAESYSEWLLAAQQMDAQRGLRLDHDWALSQYYDAALLQRLTAGLRRAHMQLSAARDAGARRAGEEAVCEALGQGALKANAGGWENREVWARAYSGPPRVVEEFVEETVACINLVRQATQLPAAARLQFFRQAARQQGRTALCLSGGAAMGWKHLGVARSLLLAGRLPRVVSGASAGSLVAALLGTHTDSELRQIVRPELAKYITPCYGPGGPKLRRWAKQGHYFDPVEWAARAQVFTRGAMTFREAFERTGRVLNVTCTPLGRKYAAPKLLNHVTAPNVIIWSAVLASACLPGVLPPMVLLQKTGGVVQAYTGSGVLWRDGSFRNDIPSHELRASLNVQFTVVSQVNPHVTLFFYDRDGAIGQPPARRLSSVWRGGFVLSALEHFLKLDIRKWLRLLRDLDLVPLLFGQDWSYVWLQKFDGSVTVRPKATVGEYLRLLRDPTRASTEQSIDEGVVATWPKLRIIQMRMRIEDAIDAGLVDMHMQVGRVLDRLVQTERAELGVRAVVVRGKHQRRQDRRRRRRPRATVPAGQPEDVWTE